MKDFSQKKLIVIYLADLDYIRLGNRVSVPLGIGSIASYCQNIYGDNLDVSLFKDPAELMREIRRRPPHILGCSFFMWNANLTLKVIEAVKIINSQTITIIGGPSVGRISENYKKILDANKSLDIIVLDQGEKSFSNILSVVLNNGFKTESIFSKSIAGCAIRSNGQIRRGEIEAKGIDINSFPSPYLMGYFDKFLAAGYLPTFETTRGCPHQCTFCSGGINSFLPLAAKDEQAVYDELNYILNHSKTKELDLADTNFGIMGERDLRISSFMAELNKKTGFPRIIGGASTKQKTKVSIQILTNMSQIMGYTYFALQTLTEGVLDNCRRKNIPNDTIKEIVAISKKNNWPIVVDAIFGLPGETLKSFLKTIDKILLLGIAVPSVYILKILPGTVIAEEERKKYGYKTKFRPLNGRYGEYELIPGRPPARVIETEEIAWQNNNFNADDYLTIRSFGFITMLLAGNGAFNDTIFYLSLKGIKFTDIFKAIMDNYHRYHRLRNLFSEYKAYSQKELFDSQEELISRITQNDDKWNDLLNNQGAFFKLDHGFSGYCLFENTKTLDEIKDIISLRAKDSLTVKDFFGLKEVFRHDKLYRIIQDKAAGKLSKADLKEEITTEEVFDYQGWRKNNFKGSLSDYRYNAPVRKIYYLKKLALFHSIIDQFSNLSGFIYYEKIIIWGQHNLRRLYRIEYKKL